PTILLSRSPTKVSFCVLRLPVMMRVRRQHLEIVLGRHVGTVQIGRRRWNTEVRGSRVTGGWRLGLCNRLAVGGTAVAVATMLPVAVGDNDCCALGESALLAPAPRQHAINSSPAMASVRLPIPVFL